MGETVAVNIIFGADDVEPILGVTALESVGIEVDPRNQRLKRLPNVRLKSLRPKGTGDQTQFCHGCDAGLTAGSTVTPNGGNCETPSICTCP